MQHREPRSRVASVLLVFACALTGPALSLDPRKAPSQFGLDNWQTEQGLPQNTVQCLAQTKDGYIWLGTQEGLVRFDGVRFVVFDKRVVPEIHHDSIVALCPDRDGSLWIGSNGGGLIHLSNGRFKSYGVKEGLTNERVWSIYQAQDGAIWAGTDGAGVFVLKAGKIVTSYSTAQGLGSDLVRSITQTPDGTMWLGMTGGGAAWLENGSWKCLQVKDGLASSTVLGVAADQAGGVWLAHAQGGLDYVQASPARGALTHYGAADGLPSEKTTSVRVDRNGDLWVGTWGGGISRRHAGRFDSLSSKQGLSNDEIWSLLEDQEGSLWVGTWVGGLNRLRDGKVLPWGAREGLSSDNARTLMQTRDGSVYIGTAGGGLNRLKDGVVTVYTTKDGLPSDHVSSLFETRDGTLILGTNGSALSLFRDGKAKPWPIAGMAPTADIRSLLEDRSGAVWIGSVNTPGLFRVSGSDVRIFTAKDGLPNPRVLVFCEARDGTVWIGTSGGGLCAFRGQASESQASPEKPAQLFEVVGVEQGLSSGRVLAIYEDAAGTLWVGTSGGGLNRVRRGADGRFQIRTFTVTKDGLPDDLIESVNEDDLGNLWFSCNKGVFRVRKADLEVDGRVGPIPSVSFGRSDGMRSAGCAGGQQPASWKDREGKLWYPTMRGVAVVDPRTIPRNEKPPNVVVEQLTVDSRLVDTREAPPELDPGAEHYEIQYTALSFVAPERVRFRYRLEGYDRDWIDAGTRRTAYFTSIPHGTYTFHVIACNDDGVWNLQGASIRFTIRPFFHQTVWFYALVAAGLVLCGAGLYGLRVRQLRARERELTQLVDARTKSLLEEKERTERQKEIAQKAMAEAEEASRAKSQFLASMSHELRTPLNAILGYSELLEEEAGLVSPDSVADLQKIQKAARYQLNLINDILDLSKVEAGRMELSIDTFDVGSLVTETLGIVRPLLEKNGNLLQVTGEKHAGSMTGDKMKVRQCLFNLLSNASKFTRNGKVSLDVSRANGSFRFEITDSGIGMTEEQLARLFKPFSQADSGTAKTYGGTGLGLALTKSFCEMMGGRIGVVSEPGHGTTFEIVLPAAPPPSTTASTTASTTT